MQTLTDQMKSHNGSPGWLRTTAHYPHSREEKLSEAALFSQKKQLRDDVTAVHNYLMNRRWSWSLHRGGQWRDTRQQTQARTRKILKRHKEKNISQWAQFSSGEGIQREWGITSTGHIQDSVGQTPETRLDKPLSSMLWFQSPLCLAEETGWSEV